MELKEVIVKKKILEDMIGKLITDFEITYGIKVDDIRIDERIESMVGNDAVFVKTDVLL